MAQLFVPPRSESRTGAAVAARLRREGYDWTALVRAVHAETLVLHGGEDLLPPAVARELAALIPSARLSIIPGAGHMPFWEAPESFLRPGGIVPRSPVAPLRLHEAPGPSLRGSPQHPRGVCRGGGVRRARTEQRAAHGARRRIQCGGPRGPGQRGAKLVGQRRPTRRRAPPKQPAREAHAAERGGAQATRRGDPHATRALRGRDLHRRSARGRTTRRSPAGPTDEATRCACGSSPSPASATGHPPPSRSCARPSWSGWMRESRCRSPSCSTRRRLTCA